MTEIEEKKLVAIPIVAAPAEPVPIMGTISKEDLDNADHYTHCQNCLVATMLHRMGYKSVFVLSYGAFIDGQWYDGMTNGDEGMYSDQLKSDGGGYDPSVVGAQILLTPRDNPTSWT